MRYFGFNGLLALILTNGGSIPNRISIQKQAYLLNWAGCPAFDDTHFYYHYYGPYSRELSDDLQSAVAAGYLEEEPKDFENGYRHYSYEFTNLARKSHLVPLEPPYDEIVTRLRSEEWRTLELAATVLYLEEDESLDERRAFTRALELKPKCERNRADAQKLVSYLRPYRLA